MAGDFYDNPNQEVVRGGAAAAAATSDDEGFDPGAATIADVQEYVTAHPEERDAVADAESEGKGRVTLLEWLDAFEG